MLLGSLLLPAAFVMISNCAVPPSITVNVVEHIGEMTEDTQFSLAQLQELSRHTHRSGKHPPFGFYTGSVVDMVAAHIANDRLDRCAGPIVIDVSLTLAGRRIEIGRELKKGNCRFDVFDRHYRRHAEADAKIFHDYVVQIRTALQRAPLTALIDGLDPSGPDDENIAHAVEAIINPALDAMQRARDAASAMIDSPAEVKRLADACGDPV